jgi:predicted type IV restriction endonuclease
MNDYDTAVYLAKTYKGSGQNEADTRHQIIDRLLHGVLAWPHSAVKVEEHVHAGFMDYVLRDIGGRAVMVTEVDPENRATG